MQFGRHPTFSSLLATMIRMWPPALPSTSRLPSHLQFTVSTTLLLWFPLLLILLPCFCLASLFMNCCVLEPSCLQKAICRIDHEMDCKVSGTALPFQAHFILLAVVLCCKDVVALITTNTIDLVTVCLEHPKVSVVKQHSKLRHCTLSEF